MASTAGYRVDKDEHGLTARDREVRDLLAKGLKPREVIERTGLSKARVYQLITRLNELAAMPPAPPEDPLVPELIEAGLSRPKAVQLLERLTELGRLKDPDEQPPAALTKSEWRATSAAVRLVQHDTSNPARARAAVRALDKIRAALGPDRTDE
jgi:hypothetical protein